MAPQGPADEFGFLVGLFLVVHTANRAPLKIEGGVELQHIGIQTVLDELFAAPGTREIAPVILDLFCRIRNAPLSAVSMNSKVDPTNRYLHSAPHFHVQRHVVRQQTLERDGGPAEASEPHGTPAKGSPR